MGDDAARHAFQIVNELFVEHVKDAPGRQHIAPMRHELLIMPVVATKFGEVVGVSCPLVKCTEKQETQVSIGSRIA